jgi:Domain of unknown function (DUF4304)
MPKTKYSSLIQKVADYLCEKGFRQRLLGFNKPGADEDCIEGITIQRGVRSLQGRFTIELGVCIPKLHTLVNPGIELPRFPHAWNGTFRERLAQTAGWKDQWWISEKKMISLKSSCCWNATGGRIWSDGTAESASSKAF